MSPGDTVRVKNNPSRIGVMLNQTDGVGGRLRVLVLWNSDQSKQFVLHSSLEKVDEAPLGPQDRILRGEYGGARDLRGAITFYRLNGKLANLIYSLNTTNTQFLPYQFKPVLNFLDSPCNGILIADEVGLGKTIEAGLIWTELRAREDAKKLLVVCPAMLQKKWQKELADRFGVVAQIVNASELLETLSTLKERPHQSTALIASIQGLRPSRGWNSMETESQSSSAKLARFLDTGDIEDALLDLVIIDEAHYLRNETTQTNTLGSLLRPVARNMVMLSATPIQLGSKDLFNLLNLLDSEAFPYLTSFDNTLRANAPIVTLRDKILANTLTRDQFLAQLNEARTFSLFEQNEQIAYFFEHPPTDRDLATPQGRSEIANQLDKINPLAKVITRTLKRDVTENRVQRDPVTIKITMQPQERAFYDQVTDAVRQYCSAKDISTGFMLTVPQRQMSSSIPAACKRWLKKAKEQEDVEEYEEIDFELYGDAQEPTTKPNLGTLLNILVKITTEIGNPATLAAMDSKYNELVKNIKQYWTQYPGNKIVLFSFFRDTLHYLHDRLAEDGIDGLVLHSGMDKHEKLDYFSSPSGPNILLSSEVASEGVDLQFSSLLINYDLPWNPAKIEQRIGRIDRIGQSSPKILIWNLVYANTVDERVYDRLLTRLDIFTEALGSMEAMLGDEIRTLSHDLLSHKLTPDEEIRRIDQTSLAIEQANRIKTELEADASQLIAHGDFIQNKVRAADELGRYIRGEDLLAYARDYLLNAFPGTRMTVTDNNPLELNIDLSPEGRMTLNEFLRNTGLLGKTRIATNSPPTLHFENKLGKEQPGSERITQDHALIRFVGAQWKAAGKNSMYLPTVACQLDHQTVGEIAPGIYVFAIARWSVSGSSDIERLEYLVRRMDDGIEIDGNRAEKLVNSAGLHGSDWLGAKQTVDRERAAKLLDNCLYDLEMRFDLFISAQRRENNDRINLMITSLTQHLQNQTDKIKEIIKGRQLNGTEKQKRMIPADEGRIKKIKLNIEKRIEELTLKKALTAKENQVSSGVIRVN